MKRTSCWRELAQSHLIQHTPRLLSLCSYLEKRNLVWPSLTPHSKPGRPWRWWINCSSPSLIDHISYRTRAHVQKWESRLWKGSFGRLVHSKQHKHYVCICLQGCPSKSRKGLVQRALTGFDARRQTRRTRSTSQDSWWKMRWNHLKSGGVLFTLAAHTSNKHRWSHLNWPLTRIDFPITGWPASKEDREWWAVGLTLLFC